MVTQAPLPDLLDLNPENVTWGLDDQPADENRPNFDLHPERVTWGLDDEPVEFDKAGFAKFMFENSRKGAFHLPGYLDRNFNRVENPTEFNEGMMRPWRSAWNERPGNAYDKVEAKADPPLDDEDDESWKVVERQIDARFPEANKDRAKALFRKLQGFYRMAAVLHGDTRMRGPAAKDWEEFKKRTGVERYENTPEFQRKYPEVEARRYYDPGASKSEDAISEELGLGANYHKLSSEDKELFLAALSDYALARNGNAVDYWKKIDTRISRGTNTTEENIGRTFRDLTGHNDRLEDRYKFNEAIRSIVRSQGDPATVEGWLASGGLEAAEMAPKVAAALLTRRIPAGGTAFWTTQTYPGLKDKMLAAGVDPGLAGPAAAVAAVPIAALENLQMKWLRIPGTAGANAVKQKATAYIAKALAGAALDLGKDYLKENATEALQSVGESAATYVASLVDSEHPGLGKQWLAQEGVEFAKEMKATSAAMLFLMGPGAVAQTGNASVAAAERAKLSPEIARFLQNPQGAAAFASINPDMAANIAGNPTPENIAEQTGTRAEAWQDEGVRSSFVVGLNEGVERARQGPQAGAPTVALPAGIGPSQRQEGEIPTAAISQTAEPITELEDLLAGARSLKTDGAEAAPSATVSASPMPAGRTSTVRAGATLPAAPPPGTTPPDGSKTRAAPFAQGGVAYLYNGSRVTFGKGAVAENGDIAVPERDGKPARTVRAAAISRIESPDGRNVWRRPAERPSAQTEATAAASPSTQAAAPNAPFAEGGVAYLYNGSRVAFGKGAVAENGDIAIPDRDGKPARTIRAAAISRIESPDGRTTWRQPATSVPGRTSPEAEPPSRGERSATSPPDRSVPRSAPHGAPPAKSPITKADVQEAFRGQRVEERPDGSFRVYLENGKFLTVRRVDDLGNLNREAAERSLNRKLTDEEWANFRVHGAFTITWSDGRQSSSYGLIRLVNGAADSRTLRHEMLHAARSLGLITPAEWRALVEKYAPESKNDGHAEERIAENFEIWRGPEGLWQRLTTAINRVLSSLGVVNPSADTAFARLREGKVWSRAAQPETNIEARRRMAGEAGDGRTDPSDLETQTSDSHRQAGDRTWDTSVDGGDPNADGVRYSGRIDRSRQEAVARLAASKPIAVSVDRSTPHTGDARRNAIRTIAARLEAQYADRPLVNEASGRQIVVDLAGLRRFGDLSAERSRWSLIHSIDRLLRSATPMSRAPGTGPGKSGREITAEHALGNIVEIDGDTYVVKHTLEEHADGRLHYAGTTIVKTPAGQPAGKAPPSTYLMSETSSLLEQPSQTVEVTAIDSSSADHHQSRIAEFRKRAGKPAFEATDSSTGTAARAVADDGRASHGLSIRLSPNSEPYRMEVLAELQAKGYFKNATNIGQVPVLAHAEAHALLRAAKRSKSKVVAIYVDRQLCDACRRQLGLIADLRGIEELTIFELGTLSPVRIRPRTRRGKQ